MPWVAYPGMHPFHIHWRMGEGEGHLVLLEARATAQSDSERAEVLRRTPVPADWAWWASERIEVFEAALLDPTFDTLDFSFEEVRDALATQGIEVVGMPEKH